MHDDLVRPEAPRRRGAGALLSAQCAAHWAHYARGSRIMREAQVAAQAPSSAVLQLLFEL